MVSKIFLNFFSINHFQKYIFRQNHFKFKQALNQNYDFIFVITQFFNSQNSNPEPHPPHSAPFPLGLSVYIPLAKKRKKEGNHGDPVRHQVGRSSHDQPLRQCRRCISLSLSEPIHIPFSVTACSNICFQILCRKCVRIFFKEVP
jgi:hypothetical protein